MPLQQHHHFGHHDRHGGHHQPHHGAMRGHHTKGYPDLSVAALARFTPLSDQDEILKWSLYDSAIYPAAGTNSLTFFQSPIGQGTGFGGAAKVVSDTNMTLAGQLSRGQNFLAEMVEVEFWPTTGAGAAVKDLPGAYGAGQAAQILNDAYFFARSGVLQWNTSTGKPLLVGGPMGRYPATKNFGINAAYADATTAGAAQQSRAAFGYAAGDPFVLHPTPIFVPENMGFSISLGWPEGPQALPSGNPARVFVRLSGLLVRKA